MLQTVGACWGLGVSSSSDFVIVGLNMEQSQRASLRSRGVFAPEPAAAKRAGGGGNCWRASEPRAQPCAPGQDMHWREDGGVVDLVSGCSVFFFDFHASLASLFLFQD